jgi:hypothetical protein
LVAVLFSFYQQNILYGGGGNSPNTWDAFPAEPGGFQKLVCDSQEGAVNIAMIIDRPQGVGCSAQTERNIIVESKCCMSRLATLYEKYIG